MFDKLNAVGQAPAMTPIIDPRDRNGDRRVTMPMPQQEVATYQPNSLWAAGSRSWRAWRSGPRSTPRPNRRKE